MLEIKETKKELKGKLDCFIWDFKIGDNILYNLDILFELVDDYNNLERTYGKPVSVIAVSIMEAIMVDFIYRLYDATSHFPKSLSFKESEIKLRLKGETTKVPHTLPSGQEVVHYKLKNFNFAPMVQVYKEFNLLGENVKIYRFLLASARLRNRLHITNYFNNFEKDENVTFSEKRVQNTLSALAWFFNYFATEYKRPW